MEKILLLCALLGLLGACENATDVQQDITALRAQRTTLIQSNDTLQRQQVLLQQQRDSLQEVLQIQKILVTGQQPIYMLKLELKQQHYTLDLTEHLKDAANAVEFELPVAANLYNQVKVGTEILDEFRYGSLILHGSWGDWVLTVVAKRIITV